MAKKYIDADELLNEVLGTMFSMSMCLSEQAWRGMKHAQQIFARMIETAPAADVAEVVRCGECEWWTKQEASCQGRCERYGIYPTAAWYCAAGTKIDKEDENNEV